jgi:hypothetical protein
VRGTTATPYGFTSPLAGTVLATRSILLNDPVKDPPLAWARRQVNATRAPHRLARLRKLEGLIGIISYEQSGN